MRRPNGRRRVEMARIQNPMNRQVTFSKRYHGLFKKATELCTLCGAYLAIVIFAPKNKVYSLGNPSVESIIDRFLGVNAPPGADADAPNPIDVPQQSVNADALNRQLNSLVNAIEREKERGEALQALRTETPFEQLSFAELEKLYEALEDAEEEVERVASQQMEYLVEFPYQTLGSAFAPLRDIESSLPDFDEGPSESHGE